jgi:hypothetical protein
MVYIYKRVEEIDGGIKAIHAPLNPLPASGGIALIATQEGNQVVLKEWTVKK